MNAPDSADDAPARADVLCQLLATAPSAERVAEAAALLKPLRDAREFARLCELAEHVCRHRSADATAWRLYAQGLIETGRLTLAVALLNEAGRRFGAASAEADEFDGLLGRAHKQLLMDTPDPGGTLARGFLDDAAAAYARPYARDRTANFWHGVNLAALAHAAASRGLPVPKPASEYLAEMGDSLQRIEPVGRDGWWFATQAEVHAALGAWRDAEDALIAYLEHPQTRSFNVGSTLRQWRDVWRLQDRSPQGARLVQVLEAQLMRWPQPGVTLKMSTDHLVRMRELEPDDDTALQGGVSPKGRQALKWYREGLQRAASVAAVSELNGLRFGTGFAVRAADFGVMPGDTILLLTNHHVVNAGGFGSGGLLDAVEIVFEAADGGALTFGVDAVVAESPAQGGLDYCLVQLKGGDAARLVPVPVVRSIAGAGAQARVYVIGYPLGDVMQFSLHDNVLEDHECEPTGKPPAPQRRLLHYSASTEKGSSGSPVFDEYWRCIGLHHAGAKRNPKLQEYGLPGLNGSSTMVDANEGIWIGSIVDDVKARAVKLGGST